MSQAVIYKRCIPVSMASVGAGVASAQENTGSSKPEYLVNLLLIVLFNSLCLAIEGFWKMAKNIFNKNKATK